MSRATEWIAVFVALAFVAVVTIRLEHIGFTSLSDGLTFAAGTGWGIFLRGKLP